MVKPIRFNFVAGSYLNYGTAPDEYGVDYHDVINRWRAYAKQNSKALPAVITEFRSKWRARG